MAIHINVLYHTDVFIGGGTTIENTIIRAFENGPEKDTIADAFDRYVSEVINMPFATSREATPEEFGRIYPAFMKTRYPTASLTPETDGIQVYEIDGSPLFYQHYVRGDAGITYFTALQDIEIPEDDRDSCADALYAAAALYGYSNPSNVRPVIYRNFRDHLTLLATLLAEQEDMSGEFTVKHYYTINGPEYIILVDSIVVGYLGEIKSEVGYCGFVHIGG